MIPELTVVIPTRDECDNIRPLIERLDAVLGSVSWEAVFVDDDSRDGTAEMVRAVAETDDRVRCLRRIGRRGLSSACIEGMLSGFAPFVAVMDGDLQHDEGLLPEMLETLKADDVDIVVGSRYMAGGGVGEWDQSRRKASRAATWFAQRVVQAELTDPLSGFFMIKRSCLDGIVRRLSGRGTKILVDIFTSGTDALRFRELPYQFRTRHSGVSKLDGLVVWNYFMLLAEKQVGNRLPVRFVMFVAVGASGMVVHLAALGVLIKMLGQTFAASQALAVVLAIAWNYLINNLFTYRDRRHRGWRWFGGLLSFLAACSVGAVINYSVALHFFGLGSAWWLAGILGAGAGAVWNFAITATFTWRRPNRDR